MLLLIVVVELVGRIDLVLVLMERYWTSREISGADESGLGGGHSRRWGVCCRASGLRMNLNHGLLGSRSGERHLRSGGHGSRQVVRTSSDDAFPPWTGLLWGGVVVEGGAGEIKMRGGGGGGAAARAAGGFGKDWGRGAVVFFPVGDVHATAGILRVEGVPTSVH